MRPYLKAAGWHFVLVAVWATLVQFVAGGADDHRTSASGLLSSIAHPKQFNRSAVAELQRLLTMIQKGDDSGIDPDDVLDLLNRTNVSPGWRIRQARTIHGRYSAEMIELRRAMAMLKRAARRTIAAVW